MEERFQAFTGLLADINRCIHKIKAEEMAEFDLKSSHVSCLYYLYNMVSLTARELCDLCREDKANISRSIKYLENNGYLVCTSKTAKRYQSPLRLTEMGQEVGERISRKIDHIVEKASEGLIEEHRIVMYRSLSLVSGNLQRLCDSYGG